MKADDVNSLGLIKDVDNYPTGSKDGTDWFISFSINFNDLVSMLAATNIVVNQSTPMAFIAATSTQGNSLNQDINGAPKIDNTNNDQTWVALGASTNPISPDGQVPEPAAMGLVALGGIWLLIQKRVKRHRADNA
jgi:hypothetical protein